MTTRGRKPTPKREKKLMGFPGKGKGEHLVDAVPEDESNLEVMPPAWLSEISGAIEVWKELRPRMRVKLEPCNVHVFAHLCVCIARLGQCEMQIEKEGLLTPGQKRNGVKHPLHQVARQYRASIHRWAPEFYLTPAATQRIVEEKPKKKRGILNGEFVHSGYGGKK